MPRYWVLDGKTLVPATLLEWATWMETGDRHVEVTEIAPGIRISTVCLGIAADHRSCPPLVFETMVFTDYGGELRWRDASWDDALATHHRAVAEMRAKLGLQATGEQTDGPPDDSTH